MDINPYAAPAEIDEPAPAVPSSPDYGLGWCIVRWMVICPICAVPTLLVALDMFHRLDQLAAILCGSVLIVAAFILVERSWYPAWHKRLPHLRTALRVAFIARMVISVLFPIGLMLDVINGLVSTEIVNLVLPVGGSFDGATPIVGDFLAVFVLTLVDGFILISEVVLFAFVVHFFLAHASSGRKNAPLPRAEVS